MFVLYILEFALTLFMVHHLCKILKKSQIFAKIRMKMVKYGQIWIENDVIFSSKTPLFCLTLCEF